MKYHTTSIKIHGAICGNMWMPQSMASRDLNKYVRGTWGFYDKGDSFREALMSLLNKEGGDFQNAEFSADTVILIERKSAPVTGVFATHIKEIPILKLEADLVNTEWNSYDFNNGEDY